MGDTSSTAFAPAEVVAIAGGGLIAAINTALPATTAGVNPNREAAYLQLAQTAIEFRRILVNADSQMDAAVITALNATLATI